MIPELSKRLLTIGLADEWLAHYQYWTALNCSRGPGKLDIDPEFEQHSSDEMDHANEIMLRLKELGGEPIADPKEWILIGNPWKPILTRSVKEQIEITMKAEQIAINFYKIGCETLRGNDFTTFKLFESNLKDEEEHLYDLQEVYAANFGNYDDEIAAIVPNDDDMGRVEDLILEYKQKDELDHNAGVMADGFVNSSVAIRRICAAKGMGAIRVANIFAKKLASLGF